MFRPIRAVRFLKLVALTVAAATMLCQAQTQNYIAKFNASGTPVNSSLFDNGNIGIGTTNPIRPLDVIGDIRVTGGGWGFRLNPVSGELRLRNDQDTGQLQFHVGSLISDWAVGIGATNPDRALVIGSTGSWNGASGVSIRGSNPGLEFADTEATPQKWLMANGVNAANDGILGLAYDEKVGAHRLVILPGSGNIGLGTNFPGARLEVNGSVKISAGSGGGVVFPDATTQTTAWTGVLCGGDYAESVDVSGARTRYEPGDIIVIDLADPENFTKSTSPYSKTVAGIYSTKPGAVGRRFTDPDKVKAEIPMAMIGIVPTKVSAENGPIERGDLLVTSATAGYAMKGTDSARMLGAVVGKALGSLNNGTGVINVLVTLQ